MNICFVYKSDYPWDVRVEKIVQSIRSRGHNVFLVCSNLKGSQTAEVYQGINMRRLPRFPKPLAWINRIFSIPIYLNFVWLYYIAKCVRRERCDVIVVRDLPLLLLGIIVARIYKKKIVYDMAECYPNMYQSIFRSGNNKFFNFILKNHYLAYLIELISIQLVDLIIVMIEESYDRLLKKGVKKDKIIIIKNTPSLKRCGIKKKYDQKPMLRLLYVGFVSRIRGLNQAVGCLAHYYRHKKVEDPEAVFDIIGIGKETGCLEELIRRHSLGKVVKLHGWCSHQVVDQFYRESDIGILTYPQTSHWNSTIPNKLFDYMAMGMPVIASEVKPIRRIVLETRCGMIIDPDNPETFTAALLKLSDPDYRRQLGFNGIRAIKKKYNWENDIEKLWRFV